jgi:ABC-2 type transport system permease protein
MRRPALVLGSIVYQASTFVVQALIILAVGIAAGARFDGGPLGAAVAVGVAVLLGSVFAALSDAVALLVRSQDALIGVSQFITLPLTFLSSVMMAPALMPGWVSDVARFNPVDWAAVAAREALTGDPDWGVIGIRVVLLAGLAVVMTLLATSAFRAYRRSV